MDKILQYLRLKEWMSSKIIFMTGIFLFIQYGSESMSENTIANVATYFIFASMFMASSYVANDFSDIKVDKKAGKKKLIAELPRWAILLSFVVMFLIGNMPIMLVTKHKVACALLIVVIYFLGLAYSGMGLRFKEKGVWGLLECSLAQRCMPLLLIPCLIEMDLSAWCFLIGWLIISFLDGLRYILIHQSIDLQNDLRTGVQTFVSTKRMNYRNSIIVFFWVETLLVCMLMVPFWLKDTLAMLLVTGLYFACEYCIYQVLNVYAKKDWFLTFDSVPLEAFFNIVFPTFVGLCLVKTNGWFFLLYSLMVLLICREDLMIKFNLVKVYVQSKLKRG